MRVFSEQGGRHAQVRLERYAYLDRSHCALSYLSQLAGEPQSDKRMRIARVGVLRACAE